MFLHTARELRKKLREVDGWEKIPFFTKDDFAEADFNALYEKALKKIKKEPRFYILKSTSGTTKSTSPILILKKASFGSRFSKEYRTIFLQNSYSIVLNAAIGSFFESQENEFGNDCLIVNPKEIKVSVSAISDFNPDVINTQKISVMDPALYKAVNPENIKAILMSGNFLENCELALLNSKYKNSKIILDYRISEISGVVGKYCEQLFNKKGLNFYHPVRRNRILEIVDLDDKGAGELVVTTLKPVDISIIRYKTGDIVKAFFEKCECGRRISMEIIGRKNFDYIKCAGGLLVRAEVERVMNSFVFVEYWRAEAREVFSNLRNRGEITFFVKLKQGNKKTYENGIDNLIDDINNNLFLSPDKRLIEYINSGDYLMTKVELEDQLEDDSIKMKYIRNVA